MPGLPCARLVRSTGDGGTSMAGENTSHGVRRSRPRAHAGAGEGGAREGDIVLVDVREPYEWDAGRIRGATHIELERLASRAEEVPDRPAGRVHVPARRSLGDGDAGVPRLGLGRVPPGRRHPALGRRGPADRARRRLRRRAICHARSPSRRRWRRSAPRAREFRGMHPELRRARRSVPRVALCSGARARPDRSVRPRGQGACARPARHRSTSSRPRAELAQANDALRAILRTTALPRAA